MIVEKQGGASAMSRVALLIAVDEVRPEFPQVVRSYLPIAHQTQRSGVWRPPIHQDESHVASPDVKESVVSDGWEPAGGAAQRSFLPLGWSIRPPRKGLDRFTAQAPCSRILNFGELPEEVRRDRQAA
jgi:hypothetical protein